MSCRGRCALPTGTSSYIPPSKAAAVQPAQCRSSNKDRWLLARSLGVCTRTTFEQPTWRFSRFFWSSLRFTGILKGWKLHPGAAADLELV